MEEKPPALPTQHTSTDPNNFTVVKSSNGALIKQPTNVSNQPNTSDNIPVKSLLSPKAVDEFLAKTYTKPQALRRLRVIKDFLNYKLFSTNNQTNLQDPLESFKQSHLADLDKDKLVSVDGMGKNRTKMQDIQFLFDLGNDFFSLFNPVDIDKQINELTKAIEITKSYVIYLPIELPEEESDRLGKWFKENVGLTCLIEINYDPNLIGGCAISSNGIYKNYSISQKIHDNKEAIIQALTSYKQ